MSGQNDIDTITGEEITGVEVNEDREHDTPRKRKGNAFTELMSKKPKTESIDVLKTPKKAFFPGRDGLGAYIANPAGFTAERMIYHTDKVAVIFDLYPKASLHALVLARDEKKSLQHPFDAFEDPVFLQEMKVEVAKTRDILASELSRRYGSTSKAEQDRIRAMEADDPPAVLPQGRDWSSHITTGVHAHPSMNHLHVHVFARDMVSPTMKKRKHYETFNTPFLIPLEAFPLAEDDPRRHPQRSGYLDQDLKCWRCGQNFGNKFARLKAHLDEEFQAWKME